ncbi:TonB-dependent receptor [Variovorax guangxiensis]|uniref:TonB-dependent siderophore receptor n=1 Tax=Variovorax guangxiensis TaxID=1775474 RepID=UPI002856ABDB|nr:TonB-dependent receptor [Variovorax guangxiensis]MDR6858142.1 iron complex outermembrane receptor protein [Variovorax guangxiensis]
MSNARLTDGAARGARPTPEPALPPFSKRSTLGLHAGATLLVLWAATQAGRAQAQEATGKEAALPTVTVTAESQDPKPQHLDARVNGGALGARTQLDTPFSTTVVKSEDLAERQVSKLGDVFALDASVSDNSGAYSAWASYLTVRGLPLDWQNAYRIDGKPFLSYAITLPYEHFEQIELLKGSSGFMYGFGSPGGIVNYVTKKPTEQPVRSIDVGYKSDSVWSEHVDLGGRFGADDRFGYRLNATHEEGKTFNDGGIRRDSVSLALDARLTRDLSWNFDTLYQKRVSTDQTPSIYTGGYVGTRLPSVVRSDNQDLVGGGQHLTTDLKFYSTGLQYKLSPDWTLSASYSHSSSTRSRNEGILFLQDASGNYDDYRSDSREGHRFDQWQAMAEGRLRTGAIEHQLTLGASWQKQINDYSSNDIYQLIGTGNIFGRNTNGYASATDFSLYRNSDITQRAVFASDTVKLSEQWSVLAGLRNTDYQQNGYGIAGDRTSEYAKNGVVTPTLALMFKPAPDTTLYTSYVESLEPGSTVGNLYANDGELLKPLKSKQYELGIKTDRERWSGTAALFRIERGAEYANSANVLVQDGQAIYQGLELAASTRLGSQWQIGGNLMFLDSAYRRGSSNVGNRVAGAPNFVATAQVSYAVPQVPGLKLSADAKYTSGTMLDASNQLKLPGYAIANIGASYATRIGGHDTTFRFAVNNLTNKRYWEFQYDNYIKPGDPRTFSVSAKVDF